MENIRMKIKEKIFQGGWGSSCGGGCSPTYYYHPEKAYIEAHKQWHNEILKVFNKYEEAIKILSDELAKTFEKENLKLELAIVEELKKLKIKAIELEELEEETEEIKEKKIWLDDIIKEINEILNI